MRFRAARPCAPNGLRWPTNGTRCNVKVTNEAGFWVLNACGLLQNRNPASSATSRRSSTSLVLLAACALLSATSTRTIFITMFREIDHAARRYCHRKKLHLRFTRRHLRSLRLCLPGWNGLIISCRGDSSPRNEKQSQQSYHESYGTLYTYCTIGVIADMSDARVGIPRSFGTYSPAQYIDPGMYQLA